MTAGPGHEPIARTALVEALQRSAARRVTVMVAPAGSGKSELLRAWRRASEGAVRTTQVTLTGRERDPAQLWPVVSDALGAAPQERAPDGSLQAGQAPSAPLQRLLDHLATLQEDVVMVLDDVHVLIASRAEEELAVLLARAPARVRFVLAGRCRPELRLHQLPLSGDLAELGTADLRFTEQEAREVFDGAGLVLSDAGVRAVHGRTEGWAAGLRLAASTLAGDPDPERAARLFSGNDRTVADYLTAEVLDGQPESVRQLLVRTCVLEEVSGPLADAVAGTTGAARTLHRLADAGAFVVPTARPGWFRYHTMLVDVLRGELRRTLPTQTRVLHSAAAAWFSQHDHPVEAVRHWQWAEDWTSAARELVDTWLPLAWEGRGAALNGLLAAFPARLVAEHPELTLVLAADEMASGSLGRAVAAVAAAERGVTAVPPERLRHAELMLDVVRLRLARRRGNLDEVAILAARLLNPRGRAEPWSWSAISWWHELRAEALHELGVAELWSTAPAGADRHLREALELARRAGLPYLQVTALGHLAMAGHADSYAVARQRCQEAIDIADAHGWGEDVVVGSACSVLAGALTLMGRFEEAGPWLERADQVSRMGVEPATALMVHLGRGLLNAGRGEDDAALACFRAAEREQSQLTAPHGWAEEAHHMRLQAQVRLGHLEVVRSELGFAQGRGEGAHARITLATLRLAEDDPAAAVEALAPVLAEAEQVSRVYRIEAVLLGAIAQDRLEQTDTAEQLVERALRLAEPDGLLWPFLVVPVGSLLSRHSRHRTRHGALLDQVADGRSGREPVPRGGRAHLMEPLSAAELRVLGFLPTNLSTSEIGDLLYVSVNTVKTHLRRIYDKLGVHSRSAAVARSRDLDLLAPSLRLLRPPTVG